MSYKPSVKKIAVLHFLPVELYPPVMNFVGCWLQKSYDIKLSLYSTPCVIKELTAFQPQHKNIHVNRFGFKIKNAGAVLRMFHYFVYYFTSIFKLIVTRPDSILYYDTISSFPAWCYKTLFNRSCHVFIHYHEYMTKQEYSSGMLLLKWFHKLEKQLYANASWVSHTNHDRMKLFLADMQEIQIKNKFIIPNYPPYSWKYEKKDSIQKPVRFIQSGALGLESMYVKEFAEWIINQHGNATWDIYSLTISDDVKKYFLSLQTNLINFKGSVNYNDLHVILKDYDVGVVLYKGHIPNYIFNAPNKMFEYYACGLDVWFPQQMITAARFSTVNSFPQIVPVNFEKLSLYPAGQMVSRNNKQYRQYDYWAENAFEELINKLCETTTG